MTSINFVSDLCPITDSGELPRPDATAAVVSFGTNAPLPSVNDSGRISFGAGMRLPVRR